MRNEGQRLHGRVFERDQVHALCCIDASIFNLNDVYVRYPYTRQCAATSFLQRRHTVTKKEPAIGIGTSIASCNVCIYDML